MINLILKIVFSISTVFALPHDGNEGAGGGDGPEEPKVDAEYIEKFLRSTDLRNLAEAVGYSLAADRFVTLPCEGLTCSDYADDYFTGRQKISQFGSYNFADLAKNMKLKIQQSACVVVENGQSFERDASYDNGVICFSIERLVARNYSSTVAQKALIALFIHELGHSIGLSEQEAEALEQILFTQLAVFEDLTEGSEIKYAKIKMLSSALIAQHELEAILENSFEFDIAGMCLAIGALQIQSSEFTRSLDRMNFSSIMIRPYERMKTIESVEALSELLDGYCHKSRREKYDRKFFEYYGGKLPAFHDLNGIYIRYLNFDDGFSLIENLNVMKLLYSQLVSEIRLSPLPGQCWVFENPDHGSGVRCATLESELKKSTKDPQ